MKQVELVINNWAVVYVKKSNGAYAVRIQGSPECTRCQVCGEPVSCSRCCDENNEEAYSEASYSEVQALILEAEAVYY